MGAVRDCVDNAMIESFWARVQVETTQPQTVKDAAGAVHRALRVPAWLSPT